MRIVDMDPLGREVAVVLDWAATQGETAVGVKTGMWRGVCMSSLSGPETCIVGADRCRPLSSV